MSAALYSAESPKQQQGTGAKLHSRFLFCAAFPAPPPSDLPTRFVGISRQTPQKRAAILGQVSLKPLKGTASAHPAEEVRNQSRPRLSEGETMTHRILTVRLGLAAFLLCGIASAKPQVLDAPAAPLSGSPLLTSVLVLPDDQILIAGVLTRVGDTARNAIALLDADAKLDVSLDAGLNGIVTALRGPDGLIYLFGRFVGPEGSGLRDIARLDSDLNLDLSWVPMLPTSSTGATAIAFDGSTHIYVAHTGPVSAARFSLTSGEADTQFAPSFGNGLVNSMAMHAASGSLFVAGSRIGGVLKLDAASGVADTSWQPDTLDRTSERVLIDGDHVIVTGGFTALGGVTTAGVGRVSIATGAGDPAWAYTMPSAVVTSINRLSDGRLFIAGTFSSVNGQSRPGGLAILTSDGLLDSWAAAVSSASARIDGIAETAAGDLVIPRFGEGNRLGRLIRLNNISGAEVPFAEPSELFGTPAVANFAADTLGGAFILGPNYAAGSQRTLGVHHLASNLEIDPSFSSGLLEGSSGSMSIRGGAVGATHIYMYGLVGGGETQRLRRLHADSGAVDTLWSPPFSQFPSPTIRAIALDETAGWLYVGGSFSAGGPTRSLARFSTTTGAIDESWQPTVSTSFSMHLLLEGGWLYVGGSFNQVNGTPVQGLARVSTSAPATLDETWLPQAAGQVQTLAMHPTSNILLVSVNRAFDIDDGSVAPWRPLGETSGFTSGLAFDSDEAAYGVGSFDLGCGKSAQMVRVQSRGQRIDPSWDVTSTETIDRVIALPAGVLIGGTFDTVNDVSRSGLAALGPSSTVFSDGMGDLAGCVP